jgi:hypothetical protein
MSAPNDSAKPVLDAEDLAAKIQGENANKPANIPDPAPPSVDEEILP